MSEKSITEKVDEAVRKIHQVSDAVDMAKFALASIAFDKIATTVSSDYRKEKEELRNSNPEVFDAAAKAAKSDEKAAKGSFDPSTDLKAVDNQIKR